MSAKKVNLDAALARMAEAAGGLVSAARELERRAEELRAACEQRHPGRFVVAIADTGGAVADIGEAGGRFMQANRQVAAAEPTWVQAHSDARGLGRREVARELHRRAGDASERRRGSEVIERLLRGYN